MYPSPFYVSNFSYCLQFSNFYSTSYVSNFGYHPILVLVNFQGKINQGEVLYVWQPQSRLHYYVQYTSPIALCLCFIMCMATLMLSLYLRSFGFNTVGLISSDQKVVSLLVSRPSGLSRYTTWRTLSVFSKSKLRRTILGKKSV